MTNFISEKINDDSREAVAARLKSIRLSLGLNKKEFAERADLTMQTYGPFENRKRELSLIAAKRLRKAYNLPLDFIYFGAISDLPTRYVESYLRYEISDE